MLSNSNKEVLFSGLEQPMKRLTEVAMKVIYFDE